MQFKFVPDESKTFEENLELRRLQKESFHKNLRKRNRDAVNKIQLSMDEDAYLFQFIDRNPNDTLLVPPSKYPLYTSGMGFTRSISNKPIKCFVIASFYHRGGGGYIVRRCSDWKIIRMTHFWRVETIKEYLRYYRMLIKFHWRRWRNVNR